MCCSVERYFLPAGSRRADADPDSTEIDPDLSVTAMSVSRKSAWSTRDRTTLLMVLSARLVRIERPLRAAPFNEAATPMTDRPSSAEWPIVRCKRDLAAYMYITLLRWRLVARYEQRGGR